MWISLVFIATVILATQFKPTNGNKSKPCLNMNDPRIQYACMCMSAICKICDELDLAGYCIIAQGQTVAKVYDMEIKKGEIFAGENYYCLKKTLAEPDDSVKYKHLQRQFGLSEDEAKSIDVVNMRFFFYDDEERIDFSGNRLVGALPVVGSAYHVDALSKILRERLPEVVIEAERYAITLKFERNGKK